MCIRDRTYVKTLNAFYKEHPAFWQVDYSWEGFQWIVPDDSQQSVIAFLRKDTSGKQILVVCNFNPVRREGYTLGAPVAGSYKEILNSDDAEFGGSGAVHNKAVRTHKKPMHGFEQSITCLLYTSQQSIDIFLCIIGRKIGTEGAQGVCLFGSGPFPGGCGGDVYKRQPAPCAPSCGAAHCTRRRRNWAATRWRWATIWTMPWRPFT